MRAKRVENIRVKWCTTLKSELNASITRGYARGLGVLSQALVVPRLRLIVDTLIYKTLLTENSDLRDYLTRLACVKAMADLFDRNSVASLGVSVDIAKHYAWTPETDTVVGSALRSAEDDEKAAAEAAELAALGVIDVTAQKHGRNPDAADIVDEQFAFAFERGVGRRAVRRWAPSRCCCTTAC